jgi:hypothetical protein
LKPGRNTWIAFIALLALLLASRLLHLNILWAEETLPLAAARQMHFGHTLYREIWFDKPPVAPLLAWAVGESAAWRIAGALYAWLACWIAWAFARDLWGAREALWAAALLGFSLIFDFPSAVIPLASDLLMLSPHMAAVWMAYRRKPWASGALAAVAFLVNPKGVLVLAACAVWCPAPGLWLGFLAMSALAMAGLWAAGAAGAFWEQVWVWGRIYAGATFVNAPITNGIARTLGWMGFHAAAVIAAAVALRHDWPTRSWWRWLAWLAVAALGVAAGLRFFPRYYFLALPVVVLLAARGMALLPRRWAALTAALMLIPAVRFAPTYVQAARGGWRDTAMDADSRAAGALLAARAHPGATLFVWGYRPEIYVYSHLEAATRFLDSQPLTGVPADRHLTQSAPVETTGAKERRAELAASRAQFVVDGLGLYNPRLSIAAFPDLAQWISAYKEVGRTNGSVVYERQ